MVSIPKSVPHLKYRSSSTDTADRCSSSNGSWDMSIRSLSESLSQICSSPTQSHGTSFHDFMKQRSLSGSSRHSNHSSNSSIAENVIVGSGSSSGSPPINQSPMPPQTQNLTQTLPQTPIKTVPMEKIEHPVFLRSGRKCKKVRVRHEESKRKLHEQLVAIIGNGKVHDGNCDVALSEENTTNATKSMTMPNPRTRRPSSKQRGTGFFLEVPLHRVSVEQLSVQITDDVSVYSCDADGENLAENASENSSEKLGEISGAKSREGSNSGAGSNSGTNPGSNSSARHRRILAGEMPEDADARSVSCTVDVGANVLEIRQYSGTTSSPYSGSGSGSTLNPGSGSGSLGSGGSKSGPVSNSSSSSNSTNSTSTAPCSGTAPAPAMVPAPAPYPYLEFSYPPGAPQYVPVTWQDDAAGTWGLVLHVPRAYERLGTAGLGVRTVDERLIITWNSGGGSGNGGGGSAVSSSSGGEGLTQQQPFSSQHQQQQQQPKVSFSSPQMEQLQQPGFSLIEEQAQAFSFSPQHKPSSFPHHQPSSASSSPQPHQLGVCKLSLELPSVVQSRTVSAVVTEDDQLILEAQLGRQRSRCLTL